jgi:hypothetical protein
VTDPTTPATNPTTPPGAGGGGTNPPAALPESPWPALALVVGLGAGAMVLRRRHTSQNTTLT